jgi:CheY-like chemotaxis protein
MPRVLIVEDDADVALVTAAALESAGLEVQVAHTVDAAIALVNAGERYDLALVDYVPGIEFVRVARDGLAPDLLIAIYTVHDDEPTYRAEADRLGVETFLSKSLSPDELAERLTQTLEPAPSS